jgi:hypothetical protein
MLDPDLRKALKESLELELIFNNQLSMATLESAVEAVLETYRRTVVEDIARQAETQAAWLDSESDYLSDGEISPEAAALGWFADELRKHEDQTSNYTPAHLDIVAVTLTGEVFVGDDGEWFMVDDETGKEFTFSTAPDLAPTVRVLSRAREDFGVS